MADAPIMLFDLLSVAYRWYFAMKAAPMAHRGLNTSPLHGTVQTILLACAKYGSDNVVVCTDVKGAKNFRHELYPDYKSGRQKTEEDMRESLKHLRPMVEALGLPLVSHDEYEADDVIATYVEEARKLDAPCLIFTGDKDLVQLVDPSTYVVRWENDGSMLAWTERVVMQNYGFRDPRHVADMLALEGDASDCYKGIPGVGKEKARRWIRRFGGLEDVYAMRRYLDDNEREKLEEGIEEARLCKRVSEVVRNVPDLPPLESLIPWKRPREEVVEAYLGEYALNKCIAYYKGKVPKNLEGKGEDCRLTVKPPKPSEAPDKTPRSWLF